jgi:hypothetical protein
LEGRGLTQEEVVFSRDMVLLQVCSRIGKKKMEPVRNSFFAPVDSLFSDGICICTFMKVQILQENNDNGWKMTMPHVM